MLSNFCLPPLSVSYSYSHRYVFTRSHPHQKMRCSRRTCVPYWAPLCCVQTKRSEYSQQSWLMLPNPTYDLYKVKLAHQGHREMLQLVSHLVLVSQSESQVPIHSRVNVGKIKARPEHNPLASKEQMPCSSLVPYI